MLDFLKAKKVEQGRGVSVTTSIYGKTDLGSVARIETQHSDKSNPADEAVRLIHAEFESASDVLLAEAKEIISKGVNQKAKALHELGFYSAAGVREHEMQDREKENKIKLCEMVNNYQITHPQFKFITEEMVRRICGKYGLVFGPVYIYKGDVPKKNIDEIKNFLKKELSCASYELRHFGDVHKSGMSKAEANSYDNSSIYTTSKSPMMICAPLSDMDMGRMRLSADGYTLQSIPDPIVLQPVIGGYFIVTKWGIEAEDKDLTNEKMN